MNEIVNKLLLAGDKFMPEMHLCLKFKPAGLAKSGFTYSACGPFTKDKKKKKKKKKKLKKQETYNIFIKTN